MTNILAVSDLEGLKGRVRLVLTSKNLSERAWSLAAGVGHSYVSQLLRGKIDKRGPSQGTVGRLAKAAGVDADWLWTGRGESGIDPAKVLLHQADGFRIEQEVAKRRYVAVASTAEQEIKDVVFVPLKELPKAREIFIKIDSELRGPEVLGIESKYASDREPFRWALMMAWHMTGPPVAEATEEYIIDLALLAEKHASAESRVKYREYRSLLDNQHAPSDEQRLAEFVKEHIGDSLASEDPIKRKEAAQKIIEYMRQSNIAAPSFIILLKAILGVNEVEPPDHWPPWLQRQWR